MWQTQYYFFFHNYNKWVFNYIVYVMKNLSNSQLNGIYKMWRLELLQLGQRNLKNIFLLFFFNVLGTKHYEEFFKLTIEWYLIDV